MRILKIIGIVVIALIAIFLIMGAIAPKEVTAERSTVIEAPQEMVFNYVNDLSTWEDWSPWKEMDPEMQVTMGEVTTGEGASYTWKGNESGSGEMRITESTSPKSIKTEVAFDGMGVANGDWTFEPAESGTRVSWGFQTEMPFPMNAMLLFMDMEESVGKDFARGLEILKEKVEAKASEMNNQMSDFEVKIVDMPHKYFIAHREEVTFDKMQEFYANTLGKVSEAASKSGANISGMPSGLYYSWDEENNKTDMAGAVPIKEKVEIDGFTTVEIPQEKTLLVEYYGSYDGLGAVHGAIEAYINKNGITSVTPAIEEYVTDPTTVEDPSQILTKIYYPIEAEEN